MAFSFIAWNRPWLIEKYSFQPVRVLKNQEWYRFITSGFLHSDTSHLFFNMFSMFFFGRVVEHYFDEYNGSGAIYLLVMYFSALIISDMATFVKQKNNNRYHSIGASGAVSAVVFSGIWFAPTAKIYVLFFPMPGFLFGALYLIYTAWAANNQRNDYINHDAHFYGSLWGIIFTTLVEPQTIVAFFHHMTRFSLF